MRNPLRIWTPGRLIYVEFDAFENGQFVRFGTGGRRWQIQNSFEYLPRVEDLTLAEDYLGTYQEPVPDLDQVGKLNAQAVSDLEYSNSPIWRIWILRHQPFTPLQPHQPQNPPAKKPLNAPNPWGRKKVWTDRESK